MTAQINAAPPGFVNDFRTNAANTVAPAPLVHAEADTLGNVYIFWRSKEELGQAVLQKRRETGQLVWERIIEAHGFDFFSSWPVVSVDSDQRRILLSYVGVTNLSGMAPSAASFTGQGFVSIYDSSGQLIVGPVWVDSVLGSPSTSSDIDAAVFRGDGGFSAVTDDPDDPTRADMFLVNFDSTGQLQGSPQVIDECTDSIIDCHVNQFVRAEELPDGGFVVTWDNLFFWGNGWQNAKMAPFYRIYDSNGMPIGPPRLTNLDSTNRTPCFMPDSVPFCEGNNGDVAVAEDGSFLIGWNASVLDPPGWPYLKCQARIFNIHGNPLTDPFLVNDAVTNVDGVLPFAGYGNGFFYLIWSDCRNTSFQNGMRDVYAQKISMDGSLMGANYRLNDPAQSPRFNDITYAVAPMQNVVLALWGDFREWPDSGQAIYAQITPDSLFGVYWPGDISVNYSIDAGDIISEVNHIFKSGQPAMGGTEYSDISGDCTATAADIILLVNYVFKSGPPPLPPCE